MSVIISGFPGIGKTYIYNNEKELKISDSDSSAFSWVSEGVRNLDFPNNYMKHIKSIYNDYDIIFVSSHKVVRDALRENRLDFIMVYPNKELKDVFMQRYKNRGNDEGFMNHIDLNWDSYINEIESECEGLSYFEYVELTKNSPFLSIRKHIINFIEES